LQDISSMVPGLAGHASMNGTNMVSIDPDGSLPSSTSEATANVPRGNPELDIPDAWNAPNVHQGADSFSPDTATFSSAPTTDQSFSADAQSGFINTLIPLDGPWMNSGSDRLS
jgi:hypothetical protein